MLLFAACDGDAVATIRLTHWSWRQPPTTPLYAFCFLHFHCLGPRDGDTFVATQPARKMRQLRLIGPPSVTRSLPFCAIILSNAHDSADITSLHPALVTTRQ